MSNYISHEYGFAIAPEAVAGTDEVVIAGYLDNHPIVITKTMPDPVHPNIIWAFIRCVDGTKPFLQEHYHSSHYSDTRTIRLDVLIQKMVGSHNNSIQQESRQWEKCTKNTADM